MKKFLFLILSILLIQTPCFALKKENLKNYLRYRNYQRNYNYPNYDYEYNSDFYLDNFEYESDCEMECFCNDWGCCYNGYCECECIDWDCDCY